MGITILNKYKAAVVQAEPGWFDLELSVQKTVHRINEAGKAGCKLIAFPEMWIPGYPYWLWRINYSDSLALIKRYRENCLPAGSDEMRRIRAAARDNAIFVSLGFSEIELATCFISQVMISPTGEVINHRRKIKPSHVEKLIYGDGSGDTFETVIDTEIGRLGQFNCWENTNPFLRAYAVSKGEQVHVAAWPLYTGASTQSYPNPWICSAESTELETRSYALEVGTYTLAPFQIISAEGVRKNTPEGHAEEEHFEHYNGHARAFGPGGSIIVDKQAQDFEGLLFVDIDLAETHLPKALMDFGGHYMRPDLMRLLVDTRRKDLITHADEEGRIIATRTIDRVGLSKPLDSPSAARSSREVADLDLDKQGKSKTNAQRRNRT